MKVMNMNMNKNPMNMNMNIKFMFMNMNIRSMTVILRQLDLRCGLKVPCHEYELICRWPLSKYPESLSYVGG